jgi:putative membrane protein
MRKILKHFIINTTSLYLISQSVAGIVFAGGIQTLFLTGAVLTAATLVVKPIINVLLIPINLLTYGLFRWVAYAITLYLVTVVVPEFKILFFNFSGFDSYWFSIPAIDLTGLLAFLAFSFLLAVFSSIVYWIFH